MTGNEQEVRAATLRTVARMARRLARTYDVVSVREAVAERHPEMLDAMERDGSAKDAIAVAAVFARGTLEGLADIFTYMSATDDAAWAKVEAQARGHLDEAAS